MKKLTKIVATISDRRCDPAFLRELRDAGMSAVRLNTAHQGFSDTLKVIENVRKVSLKIPLILDTKGPEIRTVGIEEPINVRKGDKIILKGGECSTKECVCVSYADFERDIDVGQEILIDDGELKLIAIERSENGILCEVLNDGAIKGKKSVNVPGADIHLPSLTKKDYDYVNFAIEHGIDFIAHSFVRRKEDLLDIQRILDAHKSSIKIIAKIENEEGVANIDEILDHCYGIMVARGDLGIEISAEKIPAIQKGLIKKCIDRKKPVIIATQMLHTMIKNPRPTRAEVSDIANAIYDGADAIMLSGETAYGDYPTDAVRMMTKIALEVERERNVVNRNLCLSNTKDIPDFLANSAIRASVQLGTKAMITDTTTGKTAKYLASFRGKNPIYAQCYSKNVVRELGIVYAVRAEYMERGNNADEFIRKTIINLLNKSVLAEEDLVIVLAGSFGPTNGASFIEVSTVKNLLI